MAYFRSSTSSRHSFIRRWYYVRGTSKMKDKHQMYCGLCQKEVPDWLSHAQSEEHQKNLHDPIKMEEALRDHDKQIEKQMKGDQ